MRVELLFPSEYIRAADLNGRDVALTIARVQMDSLRTERGTERKPVIFFEEMEARHRADQTKENKRLVLNVTNAKTIAKLYSNETDEWKGKRITLYPTTCSAFGDTVDCIRVRPSVPQQRNQGGISEEERAAIEAEQNAEFADAQNQ